MKIQILNNTKGIIELPNSKINLMPGSNLPSHKDVKEDLSHPVVSMWEKKGVIAVKKLQTENDDDNNDSSYELANLNVASAKEVVEQTYDVSVLENWLESEEEAKDRSGVKKAINAQLELIHSQSNDDDSQDNDDDSQDED